MTATDLINIRTHSFGDNSISPLVKPPVNSSLSALPRAKLKLILDVTACLMTFRNGGYHNNRAYVTGGVTWEKLKTENEKTEIFSCKTMYSRVTWALLDHLLSF